MAGIKLEGFQGLVPRTSDRLLPNMAATVARNTKLLSGEIRGFRALEEDSDLSGQVSTLRRAFRVPGQASTGKDPNIALLANFNGPDAATTYTEESGNLAAATFFGNAQLDTAQSQFGTAALLLDGVGDYVTFPDIAAYDLSTLDWTIQGWMRFNTLPPLETSNGPGYMLFDMQNAGGALLQYAIIQDSFGYRVRLSGAGFAEVGTISGGITTGVWYHWAMTRTGGEIRAYFNGNYEVGDFGAAAADMGGPNQAIAIGRRTNGADAYFDGWIDAVEFVKGTALYTGTGSYTVPTQQSSADITITPIEWLAFDNRNVDIVRSPLVNDSFDRYYWAGETERPSMNTAARIASGDPGYWLGIPLPASAPTVTPPAGTDETRAYVYTFESAYGEEGQPSPPTLASGASAGTWGISNLPSAPPDAANRNITKINIYRTVPGNVATSFFFVAEVPIGTTSYNDNETNETVASNNLLESSTWAEPPSTMEGFVAMPNGYLVGWSGRRLLLSEPYRPHAWPAEYEQATEFDIVGLAVVGSTLVICTESQPYFGQGVSPASFTTQKIDTVEPCLSRRGIVTTPAGTLYPSVNGLVLANSSGVSVVTKDLFTKQEWADLQPQNFYAAQLGLQYIAFNSSSFGFIIDPENPMQRHVELDNFSDVEGIETDRYSGDVLILAQNRVWNWDPESVLRLQWRWKSKVYQTPKPMNFGAGRLKFDVGTSSQALPVSTVFRPYNEELFEDLKSEPGVRNRLNTLGGQVLGGSPAKPVLGLVPSQPTIIETRQPLGGSLLYQLGFLQLTTLSVRVRIIVRPDSKAEKVVFDKQILDESIFRLPTGFKTDLWQFEMIGNTTVYSLQIAETPNGLAEV